MDTSISFQSQLSRLDSAVWNRVLPVSKAVADQFIEGKNRRIICTVADSIEFNCALLSDGSGAFMILLNKSRCNKLGLVLGEQVEVKIRKDTSDLGMPMSDVFKEVMEQFNEAKAAFDSLTPGKKRSLIHWADNVKNPNIKERRAIVLFNHIDKHGAAIDFKMLNEEIQLANQAAKLAG